MSIASRGLLTYIPMGAQLWKSCAHCLSKSGILVADSASNFGVVKVDWYGKGTFFRATRTGDIVWIGWEMVEEDCLCEVLMVLGCGVEVLMMEFCNLIS